METILQTSSVKMIRMAAKKIKNNDLLTQKTTEGIIMRTFAKSFSLVIATIMMMNVAAFASQKATVVDVLPTKVILAENEDKKIIKIINEDFDVKLTPNDIITYEEQCPRECYNLMTGIVYCQACK